ncbi:MAG: DUF1501 domain-containing protein [Pseudomonadota bacterium]
MTKTTVIPSRRKFLLGTGAGLAAISTMRGGLLNMTAHAADVSGYKALVCVNFNGGLDCHDTILPVDSTSYASYAQVRKTLLDNYNGAPLGNDRRRDTLLPLDLENSAQFGGRAFAMANSMAPLHDLIQQGQAAIVGNVGPLIRPMNRTQYQNKTAPRPPKLFSHNDQTSVWMTSEPEGARLGWGGLIADYPIRAGANSNESFTSISLAGGGPFLVGERSRKFQVSSKGIQQIDAVTRRKLFGSKNLSSMFEQHLRAAGGMQEGYYEQDLFETIKSSIDNGADLATVLEDSVALSTTFPNSSLGQQLKMVARIIAIRGSTGVSRQIFYTDKKRFDTHSDQATTMQEKQRDIAESIAAFHAAMIELGESENVTLFTTSEFGRTLAVNGDGTDHGWGSHHFVVGGAVDGKKVFGTIPPSELGHDWDSGRGRLIPTVSVEQYAATLGRWFGLSISELSEALPGLANSEQKTLGFL